MKTSRFRVWTLLIGGTGSVATSACGGAPGESSDAIGAPFSSRADAVETTTTAASALPPPSARVPPRSIRDQIIYYVMPDRFSNGDTSNDRGQYVVSSGVDPQRPAEIAKHGFDPTSKYYWHGGDLAGLTTKLDYIRKLGATSIWTTPIMRNNVAQDVGSGLIAAGYHGYWVTDFVGVDPHLGAPSDLSRYVDRAHARDLKVHLDILINHTAELKGYQQCSNWACGTYVSKSDAPFKDSSGQTFDDHDYAYSYTSGAPFPALDLASFPYTPVAIGPVRKNPEWMNDVLLYHNRGNISFDKAESLIYGDLFGLDDLFTLHPTVLGGLIDIYKYWIDTYGIDGYRVDAVRHVEDEFLLQWYPAILADAIRQGKRDFFLYGEADDPSPAARSHYTGPAGLPSTLDMGFKFAAQAVFASGEPTDTLRSLFEQDDYFIDADSNAYYQTTLLGTHDSGRIGSAIRAAQPAASDAELLLRDQLAHAFLLTARGVPAVYYGDEQGFTGVDANGGTNFETVRQDMFPTQVPEYLDDAENHLIGGGRLGADHFDPRHPMYRTISALAELRTATPEFRQGAQIHRFASTDAGGGIYAYSRILEGRNREHLVVFNTATSEKTARFSTFHPSTCFVPVSTRTAGPGDRAAMRASERTVSLVSDGNGDVSVSMAPLSFRIFEAERPVPARKAAPSVSIASRDFGTGRFFVGATLGERNFARVAFYGRFPGDSRFLYLGTDDNEPYRVAVDGQKYANGATIDFKAVVTDSSGNRRESDVRQVTVENRIGTVTVTYENGNQRPSVFGILDNGNFVFPAAVPASGPSFSIIWPTNAKFVTLFFEQSGAAGAPFVFDAPITVTRDDVLAYAHIGGAGLDADIFVDDAGALSDSAANFHGVPARVLACDATTATAPVSNLPLFIKGDMNGWANHTDPTDVNYNVLAWQSASCEFDGTQRFWAPAGPYGFKFADANWLANSNFGGPFDPSSGLNASSTSANLQLQQLPATDTYPRLYDLRFFSFAPVAPSSKRFVFYRFERTNQQ